MLGGLDMALRVVLPFLTFLVSFFLGQDGTIVVAIFRIYYLTTLYGVPDSLSLLNFLKYPRRNGFNSFAVLPVASTSFLAA